MMRYAVCHGDSCRIWLPMNARQAWRRAYHEARRDARRYVGDVGIATITELPMGRESMGWRVEIMAGRIEITRLPWPTP